MAFEWYIPVLIFLARICDVSMGTTRMLFVMSGMRWQAALIGFFEVMIWALAVAGVIEYLRNPIALVAYGAGFATGTMVGMWVENRIGVGYRAIRVISADRTRSVSATLREKGYRVTEVAGQGRNGPVELAFLVIRRRHLAETIELIETIAPDAFITVERADRASGGPFRESPGSAPGFFRRAMEAVGKEA
jgi:uncharacterized protein YebE (UPF0316 family)